MHRIKNLITACLLIAGLAAPTLAQQGEKKRAELDVVERKREKKTKVGAPQLNRSAVFAVQVERKLIRGIDRTVRYLKKTAAGLPKKSAQRLQLLERILNLHMEQATYVRSEEERSYDRQWNAWNDAGRKGKEPQIDNRRSNGHWVAVIQAATEILEEYPRNKNADIDTFNKAVGLQYLGKEKEAARIFTQLIQRYPNSSIAGDAYASLGDFYFDRNDFRNAENNYKKALRYKRSKRYLWSIFKLGWCNYNLGRYKASLQYWKSLVAQSRQRGAQGAQLKDEALRDMVYSFAELRDIEGAIAYYRANGGEQYIGPFLTLLAQILADQGQFAAAISTLKRFQKVAPYAPEGPEAQKEIISLSYALSKLATVWRELARMHELYGPGSAWAKNQKDRKLVLETQALIKDQVFYYSTLTLDKAIKDNNRTLNVEAKKGFLLYLKFFPGDRAVPEVKYYLADIEFYLKNYRDAGRYYLEIASLGKKRAVRYKGDKPINIHREAAVDMVRSFVKDFEPEFKVLKKREPDFKKPKPLSIRAKNYIKACAKYMAWYPEDKVRAKTCETDVTKIYYNSGDRKNSIRFLKLIATKYSKDKEGPSAVELLIPLYKDDKKGLLAVTDELLKIPAYRQGKIGKKLIDLKRSAEKEAIASEKNLLKRARGYEAYAKKHPNDPEVDKLWYNAAVDYVSAGELKAALAAYAVIVKRFPKKPQAQESLLQIAKINEKELEFAEASGYFVEYTKRYPKSKEAPGALSKSCELLIAIESPKALSTCATFAARYPDGALDFIERLIISAERSKDYSRMADIIRKMYIPKFQLSANQLIIAHHRIYRASGGKGPAAAQAEKEMERIFRAAGDKVEGEALRYVGELAYKQTLPIVPRYAQVKLVGGSVDRLAASLEQKALALKQVEDAFRAVANTKDAYWGVAALYQMGLANEMYAEAMENPPAIQGASKEDVLKELAPQIAERKKAAMSWYRQAQETVTNFKVYNDASIDVINAMARLGGQKLTFDDVVVQPDILGSEVPTNLAKSLR